MPPTLADIDDDPIPTFLTTVGKSSDAQMYIKQKAADIPPFPPRAKAVRATVFTETVRDCVKYGEKYY